MQAVDAPVRCGPHALPAAPIPAEHLGVRHGAGRLAGPLAKIEQDEMRDRRRGVPETIQHRDHRLDVGTVDDVVDHDVAVFDPAPEQRSIRIVGDAVERIGPIEPGEHVRLARPAGRAATERATDGGFDPVTEPVEPAHEAIGQRHILLLTGATAASKPRRLAESYVLSYM